MVILFSMLFFFYNFVVFNIRLDLTKSSSGIIFDAAFISELSFLSNLLFVLLNCVFFCIWFSLLLICIIFILFFHCCFHSLC